MDLLSTIILILNLVIVTLEAYIVNIIPIIFALLFSTVLFELNITSKNRGIKLVILFISYLVAGLFFSYFLALGVYTTSSVAPEYFSLLFSLSSLFLIRLLSKLPENRDGAYVVIGILVGLTASNYFTRAASQMGAIKFNSEDTFLILLIFFSLVTCVLDILVVQNEEIIKRINQIIGKSIKSLKE